MIHEGRVTVNGSVATIGQSVDDADDVRVDGLPVTTERRETVLLNKPAGVVTTAHDPQGRPTVVGLVQSDVRLFPVGRLDRETTGALLLTNDGDLAHRLMHPRHGVEKTYVVDVEGDPAPDALDRLRRGVELEDGITAPAAVRRIDTGRIELRIHEGRNRQVRRMCEAVGHPVRRLHRSQYAALSVDDLEPGAWRSLTEGELTDLRNA